MGHTVSIGSPDYKTDHRSAFDRHRQDMLRALRAEAVRTSKAMLLDEIEATAGAMRQIVELDHA